MMEHDNIFAYFTPLSTPAVLCEKDWERVQCNLEIVEGIESEILFLVTKIAKIKNEQFWFEKIR